MISNFHGHNIDLFSLRDIQAPAINGSSMMDLVRLFEKLDFTTRAIKVEVNELKQVQCPAVLHWNLNHFVVLKSVHNKYIVIHDPAAGERKLSLEEVSSSFTGIVLEVNKNEFFSPIQAQNKLSLIDLFKNIKGLKHSLVILLLLSLAIEVFMLINPLFIQYVTDGVTSVDGSMNPL